MVEALRKYQNLATNDEHPRAEVESLSTELPPLRYVDDHEGWSTFEGPILYFYAGKGPYVSRYKLFQLLQLFSPLLPDCILLFLRELMQFPVSVPNDGMVDLVIQGKVRTYPFLSLGAPFERPQLPRVEMLKHMNGAEKGAAYWGIKLALYLNLARSLIISTGALL